AAVEVRNAAPDLDGRVSVLSVVRPGRLRGDVVRDLRLVKVDAAAVPVPERLVALEVLHEEAVRRDVGAVDDDAVGGLVRVPADARAVVRAPYPDLVHDDGVAVHGGAARRQPGAR